MQKTNLTQFAKSHSEKKVDNQMQNKAWKEFEKGSIQVWNHDMTFASEAFNANGRSEEIERARM